MLPNLQDCFKIIKQNPAFKVKEEIVNGKKVFQFSYLLAQANDFIIDGTRELRGITFIEEDDGNFTRYLQLPKFFNLNQAAGYNYSDLKDKKIINVADKLDGSLIRFVKIGSEIMAKSKFSFWSKQAEVANRLLVQNLNLFNFVRETIESRLAAIFELIGPVNPVVVPYPNNGLRLIQIRDENTGEFLCIENHPLVKKYNIPITEQISVKSLDELLLMARETKDKEGWVVTFSNGEMVKIKTKWYLNLHYLITETIEKEHNIIQLVLENKIDDVLANIPENRKDLREKVSDINNKTTSWINKQVTLIQKIALELKKYCNDRKEYVIRVQKEYPELARFLLAAYDNTSLEYIECLIVNYVRKQSSKLEASRKFLSYISVG